MLRSPSQIRTLLGWRHSTPPPSEARPETPRTFAREFGQLPHESLGHFIAQNFGQLPRRDACITLSTSGNSPTKARPRGRRRPAEMDLWGATRFELERRAVRI